jgi:butyrate kinase
MSDVVKILAINPGSTSTKIAIYENETEKFKVNIEHSVEELAPYHTVVEQYDLRKAAVLNTLRDNHFDIKELAVIAARGGLLPPLKGGAYRVNEAMVEQLKYRPKAEHASNVAALIAFELAAQLNIPAFIYDAISADELTDIARISGMPALPRASLCHVLNMRAVARKVAEAKRKKYIELNIIVTHLGGGITSSLHQQGKMVDIVSDDEGTFSPERAGGVPCRDFLDLCYSGKYDHLTMRKMLRGKGGLAAYLGTSSAIEVEKRIANGDDQAELIYQAMAYQIAKGIGELATVVNGKIDAIILTGGIAHSKLLTSWIAERVSFIGPVEIVPGENELESLALGALRVLRGEEQAHVYHLG